MKSLLFLLLCLPLRAQENWKEVPVRTFGGVDTYHDSARINDSDSQDARNVLTDSGSLEKRLGNRRIISLGVSQDIRAVHEFITTGGTKYVVFHSSNSVYQTDLGGSPVALTTTSTSYEIDAASIFGNIYVVNGFDPSWSWNGTSTAAVAGMPKCKYIVAANERIYCANTDTSNIRVSVSSFGGAGYWTVPSIRTADSPAYFDFGKADGTGITCFKETPWGKFVGKPTKSFILKGYDNNTYYIRPVDPQIGCVDNRTVQMVEGNLIWLGQNGVYSWNGAGAPGLISREVDPDMKAIRQLASNKAFWNVSSQAEFQAGNLTPIGAGAPVDATTTPGSIFMTSTTFVDTSSANFTAGTMTRTSTDTIGSVTLWLTTRTIYGGDFVDGGAWLTGTNACSGTADGGTCTFGTRPITVACPSGNAKCGFLCEESGLAPMSQSACLGNDPLAYVIVSTFQWVDGCGTTLCTVQAASAIGSGGGSLYIGGITFSTRTYISITNSSLGGSYSLELTTMTGNGFYLSWDSKRNCNSCSGCALINNGVPGYCRDVSVSNVRISSYPSSGTFVSRTFDTTVATPTFSGMTVDYSSGSIGTLTFKEQDSADGASWGTAVAITPPAQPTLQRRYWRYEGDFATTSGTVTATINQVGTMTATTTGYYYSDVHFIGTALTSWLAFDAAESVVGSGSATYGVRAATYSFTSTAATPAWTAQTNHQNIVASTGTSTSLYYQWRALFSIPYATNTISISDGNSQWQEGTAVPAASFGFEQRYGLCAMFSTTTIKNDRCAVYQRNQKWTFFDGPSYYSIGMFDKIPTAGSGNGDGLVWQILRPNLYNDDGTAINAYWTTKDFTLGSPFNEKVLHEMWVDAAYNTYASSVTVGYSANRGTSFTSKDIDLHPARGYVSTFLTLDNGYDLGKFFKFKFSNSGNDQYLKINSFSALMEGKTITHD